MYHRRFPAPADPVRDLQHHRFPDLGFKGRAVHGPRDVGRRLGVTTSDLLLILSILLLFVEILKSTRFGIDGRSRHLSLVLFVVALGEFLLVKQAATSTFLLLLVICFVDVLGGFVDLDLRRRRAIYNVEGNLPPLPTLTGQFTFHDPRFPTPGRSPVYAGNGMVGDLASAGDARCDRDAARRRQCRGCRGRGDRRCGVVEPQMTGIGGDCFCLVSQPGQPVWGYNGSGRSGAAMRSDRRCSIRA